MKNQPQIRIGSGEYFATLKIGNYRIGVHSMLALEYRNLKPFDGMQIGHLLIGFICIGWAKNRRKNA